MYRKFVTLIIALVMAALATLAPPATATPATSSVSTGAGYIVYQQIHSYWQDNCLQADQFRTPKAPLYRAHCDAGTPTQRWTHVYYNDYGTLHRLYNYGTDSSANCDEWHCWMDYPSTGAGAFLLTQLPNGYWIIQSEFRPSLCLTDMGGVSWTATAMYWCSSTRSDATQWWKLTP